MDFREEYKNSIEIMNPSAEQLERMKKNILEQTKAPEKKAVPFKKIAYIGSAVAACAVISVAAINIVPRLTKSNAELTAGESYASMMDMENANGFFDGATDSAAWEDVATNAAADHAPVSGETGSFSDMTAEKDAGSDYDISFDPKYSETEATNEPSYDYFTDNEAADEAFNDAADDVDVISDCMESATAPSAMTSAATDAPSAEELVQEAEDELMFELSDDCSAVILNDVKYILIDDGKTPPAGELVCENCFTPDGTEYRFDHYGDDYLVLSRDNGSGSFEVLGGYKKAE